VLLKLSRRHINLSLIASAIGVLASPRRGHTAATPDRPRQPGCEYGNPLAELKYGDVELGPCLQRDQLEQTHAVLMGMSEDSLLRPFRMAAGQPAPGSDLGGWYSATPTTVIAGPTGPETFGQWLSALSRHFAATGDAATRVKVQQLVAGYASTIEPRGMIFHFSRNPTYFYDKLICGLQDAYEFAGVEAALGSIASTTDAAASHLTGRAIDPLHTEGQNSSESYTIPENQLIAWQRGAGVRHLVMARDYLADDFYFTPLARGENVLAGRHAYSHVNALCSAAKAYLVLGDESHLRAAINGLAFVEQQSFATGGWGPDETFLPAPSREETDPNSGKKERYPALDTLGAALEGTRAHFETPCGSYAHFKLTRYLLRITKNPNYGDSMERVMYNTVLGALPLSKFGNAFYQSSYHHHARKEYFNGYGSSMKEEWPCCSGTLPQVAADYRISTYFRDSKGIYVNLFMPSVLRWEQNGIQSSLRQSGAYPLEDSVTFEITSSRPVVCTIRFRIPSWADDPSLHVNGKAVSQPVKSGTFAAVHREWVSGDQVELRLPRKLALQAVDPQHPSLVAVTWGPLVLFAVADDTPRVTRSQLLTAKQQGTHAAEWQVETADGPLRLVPFWAIKNELYFTYFSV
jgi:uncharacterized protein